MAEHDAYMHHKERTYKYEYKKQRGLKDAQYEPIPIRSVDGSMRSVVQEYNREFCASPEGFGHVVIDPENSREQQWFINAYMREMAFHMLRHSKMPFTQQNADLTWSDPQDFYERLNPINPSELWTSWPNTDSPLAHTDIDRPLPDILQDLLKGDREQRRKAFRYFMHLKH